VTTKVVAAELVVTVSAVEEVADPTTIGEPLRSPAEAAPAVANATKAAAAKPRRTTRAR
jgi:hypothetical protein